MMKGDLHRFGKQVSFLHDDQFVKKHRPTLIEHLFLDKRSPISPQFNALGIFSNAHIESNNDWYGECENLSPYIISENEIGKNLDFFFAAAGKLIATSTVFGLNDLHFENILFIKKNNQLAIIPVDLEVIYYKFITSAECCLYPSIKVNEETCGLKRLIPFLTVEFLTTIVDNTIEAWGEAVKLSPTVQEKLGDVPVRMIYRQSKFYAQYLINKDINIFKNDPIAPTQEEFFQMNHGDIPYFFSKFNDPKKILYFDSVDTTAVAHEIVSHPSTSRHLTGKVNTDDLSLYYTSIAHLIVNLIKTKKLNFKKIVGKNFEAEILNNQLYISINQQVLKVLI